MNNNPNAAPIDFDQIIAFPEAVVPPTVPPVTEVTTEKVDFSMNVYPPSINVEAEKNSKGYNWKVVVVGANSADQAISLVTEVEARMKAHFGDPLPEAKDAKVKEKVAKDAPAEDLPK
jgi:hypothetical protein